MRSAFVEENHQKIEIGDIKEEIIIKPLSAADWATVERCLVIDDTDSAYVHAAKVGIVSIGGIADAGWSGVLESRAFDLIAKKIIEISVGK